MIWPTKTSNYQELHEPLFNEKNVKVFMLRDDLLHPGISGNKWRKLKFNLLEIAQKGVQTIVTVGGSHSNHIAAVAEAGKVFGFNTIGLIRGYEAYRNNPTLSQASASGMDIRFLDKTEFAHMNANYLVELKEEIGSFEFIPMGGGNQNGMRGCAEINQDIPSHTTHIATACGTGSTLAGIVVGSKSSQQVIGFPAMKNGDFIQDDAIEMVNEYSKESKNNFEIITDYHFGGFAKMKPELVEFINAFFSNHGIALDGIYNGKMMFGIYDLIRKNHFPKGSIIATIHTGGVQGNKGLNAKYKIYLPVI